MRARSRPVGRVAVVGVATVPPSGDWQLAAGHFIPAKMTPVIIGPSAATEAGTDAAWSRYRRCPSGIEYRIPISVLGGAWPFYYELTTAPSGMTIGAQYGDTDYGILSWSSPTAGTHSIVARVTDQDGTIVTRSWSLECIDKDNTTYFMFLSGSGNNSNTGTQSSPRLDFEGWYTTSGTDATHAGKQAFYSTGTYYTATMTARTGTYSQQIDMTPAGSKPQVHVAVPGQSPVFDFEEAYWLRPASDFCLSGMALTNGAVPEGAGPGTRTTYVRTEGENATRLLFFEDDFGVATGYTPTSGLNPATLFFDQTNLASTKLCVSDCNFAHNALENIEAYGLIDVVFERNTFVTQDPAMENVYLKSNGNRNWSIRANSGNGNRFMFVVNDSTQGGVTDPSVNNVEVCWNSYISSSFATLRFAVGGGSATGGDIWVYRNSLTGIPGAQGGVEHTAFIASSSTPVVEYEKNVMEGFGLVDDPADVCTFTDDSSATTTDVDGYLDASNLLTGSARTTYLGTHGAEVA